MVSSDAKVTTWGFVHQKGLAYHSQMNGRSGTKIRQTTRETEWTCWLENVHSRSLIMYDVCVWRPFVGAARHHNLPAFELRHPTRRPFYESQPDSASCRVMVMVRRGHLGFSVKGGVKIISSTKWTISFPKIWSLFGGPAQAKNTYVICINWVKKSNWEAVFGDDSPRRSQRSLAIYQ